MNAKAEHQENVAKLPTVTRYAPVADVFSDPETFEHAQRVAKVFSSSNLVPAHLRGNVADCLIAYQIARRLNEEPLTVFQNIYMVNGRPGWKTEYVIARANRAGVFTGRITWQAAGAGDKLSVTAKATLAETGEAVDATCDMAMARAEGWTKNAKYTSMPEHMLRWRSAAMLIRLYAPEVMLGMPVVEELETLPALKDVTPKRNLTDALDELAAGGSASDAAEAGADPTTSPQPSTPDDAAGQPASEQSDADPAETSRQAAEGTSDSEAGKAGGKAGGKTQTAAKEQAGETTAEADDDFEPETAAQYETFAKAWIGKATDPDVAEKRWKDEKKYRNKLNVTPEVRDQLESVLKQSVAALRTNKKAATP